VLYSVKVRLTHNNVTVNCLGDGRVDTGVINVLSAIQARHLNTCWLTCYLWETQEHVLTNTLVIQLTDHS